MPMSLSRNLRAAYTVWYRDVLRFFSDRMRIVSSLGQPLLFLFVFGVGLSSAMSSLAGGEVDYTVFIYPGILAMNVLFTAVFSAVSVVWDREFGFLKEVLVAPVSRTWVALGKVAGGSTVAMFQGTLLLILAPLLGVPLSVGRVVLLVVLMIFGAGMMTSFGLLIAARQRTMEGFQMLMQFILMPMLFLSGAFFPLTNVPSWLELLARLNPVTYMVDAIRQVVLAGSVPEEALAELSLFPWYVDAVIMLGVTALFLLPAVLLFSKQD
jgi:ABC-2 type transport system permease protein